MRKFTQHRYTRERSVWPDVRVSPLPMMVFLILLVLSAVVAPLSVAATYFVDRGHPSASDLNPGTASQPWRTIQHAANTIQAGDTCIVGRGFYPERIEFPQGLTGQSGAKITFRAEPRRSASMWGFDTYEVDHLRIEGFEIMGSLTSWSDVPSTDWRDAWGIMIDSDYVEVVDNYVHDMPRAGIAGYWDLPWPRNIYVARNRVYRCTSGIEAPGYKWVIENNEVERLVELTNGIDCDYSRFFGENIIFRNNFFHGTLESEVGTSHVDGFQTFNNNGEYARNILIEGNVVKDCHQAFIAGDERDSGSVHDITVQNNLFTNCWAWGVLIKGSNHGIHNADILHNTLVNIRYHAIGYLENSAGVCKNNIFYNANNAYHLEAGAVVDKDYNMMYNTQAGDPGPHDMVDVDPVFVDLNARDFRLQSESPAIDAGTNVGVTSDMDGNARPQGAAYDIGAYEYIGSGTPAATWTPDVTGTQTPPHTPTETSTGAPTQTPTYNSTNTPTATFTDTPTSTFTYTATSTQG